MIQNSGKLFTRAGRVVRCSVSFIGRTLQWREFSSTLQPIPLALLLCGFLDGDSTTPMCEHKGTWELGDDM